MSERILKKLVVELLQKEHLLSAAQIGDSLAATGKKYNKTSIYRALEQLVAESLICRLHLSETSALYELQENHHVHIVCTQCGRVVSAPCDYQQPQQVAGIKIDHHHLTLMGACQQCQGA